MEKITDEQRLIRIKKLGVTDEEAKEILAFDKAVDRNEIGDCLTPEQKQVARMYTRTGTRKKMVLNHPKKERKPNATKIELITNFATFLEENSAFSIENVQILNKERQISFVLGPETYELTLVQKRKPKK